MDEERPNLTDRSCRDSQEVPMLHDLAVKTHAPSPVIAADRVEGTGVFNAAGDKLGVIENLIIHKRSGKVLYAVMSFGGFLGMGDHYYPVPWELLNYDQELGGYRTQLDKTALDGAPHYAAGDAADLGADDWHHRLQEFYKLPPPFE
jgi:hypothetical protein